MNLHSPQAENNLRMETRKNTSQNLKKWEVQAELAEGEGFVIGDLDPAKIKEVRTSLPALEHKKSSFSLWMRASAREAAIQYDFCVSPCLLSTILHATRFLNPCWLR